MRTFLSVKISPSLDNPTGSGLVGSEFNKPWNWPVYIGSGREVGDDGSPY